MENLKITFKLRNGYVIGKYPIHFDGLLMYAKAVDELGVVAFTEKGREQELSPLPLAMYGGNKKVYHASIGFPTPAPEYRQMYTKSWGSDVPEYINKNGATQNIQLGKGWGKSYKNNLYKRASKEIIFYAKGDKKEIERLLPYIQHIGPKGSQGQGEVYEVVVKKIKEDISIISDGLPQRTIPFSEWKGNANAFLILSTYEPPYDLKDKEYCVSPAPSVWNPLYIPAVEKEKVKASKQGVGLSKREDPFTMF